MGKGRYVKAIFSPEQEQIIIGSLFGDASLFSLDTPICNSGFRVSHSEKDKGYVFWKYQELKSTGLFPIRPKPRSLRGFKKSVSWLLQSRRDPYFTYLRSLFYPNRKKVVSQGCLEKLSPLGLAVFYMDDGFFNWGRGKNRTRKYPRVSLSTCGFTYEDNESLRDWLNRTYFLHFHINLNPYPILRLGREYEVNRFLDIVRPYIIPSMARKLGEVR